MKNKFYKIYYVSSSGLFRYIKNCDYNEYEKLFYKLDSKGFRVILLGRFIIVLKLLNNL